MKGDTQLIEIWEGKCHEDKIGKISKFTIRYQNLKPEENARIFDLIKEGKMKGGVKNGKNIS